MNVDGICKFNLVIKLLKCIFKLKFYFILV